MMKFSVNTCGPASWPSVLRPPLFGRELGRIVREMVVLEEQLQDQNGQGCCIDPPTSFPILAPSLKQFRENYGPWRSSHEGEPGVARRRVRDDSKITSLFFLPIITRSVMATMMWPK
jgi:hypothetical protein